MTTFDEAFDAFIADVQSDMDRDNQNRMTNFDRYHQINPLGGRKYVRVNVERGGSTSVYCFVAKVDVPAKRVKKGDILFPAGYNAPQLKCAANTTPARGNIFNPITYKNVNKVYTNWLYR